MRRTYPHQLVAALLLASATLASGCGSECSDGCDTCEPEPTDSGASDAGTVDADSDDASDTSADSAVEDTTETDTTETDTGDTTEELLDLEGLFFEEDTRRGHRFGPLGYVRGWGAASELYSPTTYSNDEQYFVALAGPGNERPNGWHRFDWVWQGEELLLCHSAQDMGSEEEAEEWPRSLDIDPSDLEDGCGNRPWSVLERRDGSHALQGTFGGWNAWTGVFHGTADTVRLGYGLDSLSYEIEWYDNDRGELIGRNGPNHPTDPGRLTAFSWFEARRNVYGTPSLYYLCVGSSDNTIADHVAFPGERSNLIEGCNGGEWMVLVGDDTELDIYGTYADLPERRLTISPREWAMTYDGQAHTYTILYGSNSEQWLVAENDADNPTGAGKYSRFEWFRQDGQLFYCHAPRDATSEDAAQTDLADSSSLANGCDGESWVELQRPGNVPFSGLFENSAGRLVWLEAHDYGELTWRIADAEGPYGYSADYIDVEEEFAVGRDTTNDVWGTLDWTNMLGGDHICEGTSVASFDEALGAPRPDRTEDGCDTGWQELTTREPVALQGTYAPAGDYGEFAVGTIGVRDGLDLGFQYGTIIAFDNDDKWMIVRGDRHNDWWRIEWLESAGTVQTCFMERDDLVDAEQAGDVDPDNRYGGCDGTAWTYLYRTE